MDSLFSSPRSATIEASPLIHSPLPIRKRASAHTTSRIPKAVLVNFNDEDENDNENSRPSSFFFEKLRQITCDSMDDYQSYDVYTAETASNRSSSVESLDERRCIIESCDNYEVRPISRAMNPQVNDREFLRVHQTIHLSLFGKSVNRCSLDIQKST